MPSGNPNAHSEALQFGSGDVCQLAGVTFRQLQWWDERKIISPGQQGHRRLYAVSDAIGMMVIAELRRKGFFAAEDPATDAPGSARS